VGVVTAIIGGALRAVASFAPALVTSAGARESVYVMVDVCLGTSLASFFSIRGLRPVAVGGLALALAGIAIVRLDRMLSLGTLYPVAAFATAIGVMALSGSLWSRRIIAGWVPMAFALSTELGVLGTIMAGANTLFVWSGVVFGVTFASLGCMIGSSGQWRGPSGRQHERDGYSHAS